MREYTRVVAVNIVCVNRQNPTFAQSCSALTAAPSATAFQLSKMYLKSEIR